MIFPQANTAPPQKPGNKFRHFAGTSNKTDVLARIAAIRRTETRNEGVVLLDEQSVVGECDSGTGKTKSLKITQYVRKKRAFCCNDAIHAIRF